MVLSVVSFRIRFVRYCVQQNNFLKEYHMRVILNVLWLIFGGLNICVEYIISSLLMMVTIVGIPFGFQTLKLAVVSLWP